MSTCGMPYQRAPRQDASPAALRMRRSRERQRDGMRCLTIELRETEIDALIHEGCLFPGARDDRNSIARALYVFLGRTLKVRS